METMQEKFDFPANTSVLEKIGKIASNAGRSAGFNDLEVNDIQLAVSEACANTITHGLKNDSARTFQLAVAWAQGEIEILIHEAGEPFDPLAMRDPDLEASLEERKTGGLGLYFLRKLMDEADFRIGKDGVKTWRMVKRKVKQPASDHSL
jgi:anti-sigma regulatory factor (Ser/Thr protein kinase)